MRASLSRGGSWRKTSDGVFPRLAPRHLHFFKAAEDGGELLLLLLHRQRREYLESRAVEIRLLALDCPDAKAAGWLLDATDSLTVSLEKEARAHTSRMYSECARCSN